MFDLIRLETRFLIRRHVLGMLAIGFLGFGFLINLQEIGIGMEMIHLNSPYRLAYFIGLTSQLTLMAVMILGSIIVLRDHEAAFDKMVGYLWHRKKTASQFLVKIMGSLGLGSLFVLGLLLSINWPDIQDRSGPNSFSFYLWPWLVFVVPNVLFCSVFTFALCRFFQQSMAVYMGCVLLFVWTWVLLLSGQAPIFSISMPTLDPSLQKILAFLEPFGLAAFFEQTQFWTPDQKNTQLFKLSGVLLANRIFWGLITLTGGMLLWIRAGKRVFLNPKDKPSRDIGKTVESSRSIALTNSPAQLGEKPSTGSGIVYLWYQIRLLVSSRSFWVFMLAWSALVCMGLVMVTGIFRDYSGRYPTTSFLIAHTAEALSPMAMIGMLLFAITIMWHERMRKFDGIIGATPISNGFILLGKIVALALIPLMMIATLIMICVSFQVYKGFWQIEWAHYGSLFYYFGLPLVLKSFVVLLVHALVLRSRFAHPILALVGSAGILVLVQVLASSALVHPLLHINSFPGLLRVHSEWMGYGMWASQFHHKAVLWGVWGLMILCLTFVSWPRNVGSGARRSAVIGSSLAMLIWLGIAFYISGEIGPVQTETIMLDEIAAYEKRFKKYEADRVPQYVDMSLDVAFYPNQQRYTVDATCLISNDTGMALEEMLISAKKELHDFRVENAAIRQEMSGDPYYVYIVDFDQPFEPGTTRQMFYQIDHASQSFHIDPNIVANGSCISQGDFEPLLGYAGMLEIQEPKEREERGLPKRKNKNDRGKFITRKRGFQAILSTSEDQQVVTSGRLIREWQREGRRYARFVADAEIYPMVGYFSGDYYVHNETVDGTPLTLYVHPKHKANIEEMVRATRATFNYCIQAFGPYPYDSFRIIEVPGYHRFGGKASAGVVALSEDLFVQNYADGSPINNVARNTIHEVIHQWWGEKLVPKIDNGQGVLTESITKYLEAVILGSIENQDMADRLMTSNHRRYLAGRSITREPEVSLLESENQRYLCYGKGPVVFMNLNRRLGEDGLNAVLNDFLEKYQPGMDGTLQSLVDMLCVAYPEHEARIKALFEETSTVEL